MAFSFMIDMPDVKGVAQPPYKITRLLGDGKSNAKLAKSEAFGVGDILSYGLSLAPSKASGYNLCRWASAGCIKGCLHKSGLAAMYPRTIIPPRIAKSRLLRKHSTVFFDRLDVELKAASRKASRVNAKLFVRLNVFSDVEWEIEQPSIFSDFPDIQFYDYTKGFDRMVRFMTGDFPTNYHLTFSREEDNWESCLKVLAAGYNVAIPFDVKYSSRSKDPLPQTYKGFDVIDGDISDLRPLDARPRIVGLRVKGPAKGDTTGFMQPGVST